MFISKRILRVPSVFSSNKSNLLYSHSITFNSKFSNENLVITNNINDFNEIQSNNIFNCFSEKWRTSITHLSHSNRHFHSSNKFWNNGTNNKEDKIQKLNLEEKLAKDFRSLQFKQHKPSEIKKEEFIRKNPKSFRWQIHKEVPPPLLMFFGLISLPPAVCLGILPFVSIASISVYTGFFMNYAAVVLAASSAIDIGLIIGPHLEPNKEKKINKENMAMLGVGEVEKPLQLDGKRQLLLEGSSEKKDYSMASERLKRLKNRIIGKKFQPDIISLESTQRFDWQRAFMASGMVLVSAFSLQLDAFSAAILLSFSTSVNILFAFMTTHSTDLPKWYAPLKLLQGGFLLAFLIGEVILHILSVTYLAMISKKDEAEEELKELEDVEIFPRISRPETKVPIKKKEFDENDQKIRDLKKKINEKIT